MDAPKDDDELRLERVAKRLLATPHKPREDLKLGKPRAKKATSPSKRRSKKSITDV